MTQSDPETAPSKDDWKVLVEESPTQAAALLESLHAADAAEWLQDVTEEEAWLLFQGLEKETRAEVLEYLDETLRSVLVPRLSTGDLREVIEELPADEAVDVLAEADERVAADVLESIPTERARDLRDLSAYPPESAGGVMTSEYVAVPADARMGDVIKEVRKEGDQVEEDLGVFVVDEANRPVGFLSDHALLTNPIHSDVNEAMVEPFVIEAQEDQEEAANRIAKYNLRALAVVDGSGVLVGVISADDAQDIFESEVEEDILRMVGTAPTQLQTRLAILKRVRQRLPLMGVTVAAGLASAKILGLFLGGTAGGGEAASILRYLPLIIGLAGNVGIQSSTILVRAFATGEVEPAREVSVLGAEVAVGSIIGVLCGAVTIFVASLMETGIFMSAFGGAVGVAVAAAVSWAALLGCLVPMACRRLGIDPAIVAGPFLISLSDVSGSAIYILVARLLLDIA